MWWNLFYDVWGRFTTSGSCGSSLWKKLSLQYREVWNWRSGWWVLAIQRFQLLAITHLTLLLIYRCLDWRTRLYFCRNHFLMDFWVTFGPKSVNFDRPANILDGKDAHEWEDHFALLGAKNKLVDQSESSKQCSEWTQKVKLSGWADPEDPSGESAWQ